jgi:hypothetical protein
MRKIFENAMIKRLCLILEENRIESTWIINLELDSHTLPSNIYTIVEVIRGSLEKQYFSAAFLDITQVFDKVWDPSFLFKIRETLPHAYRRPLESFSHNLEEN